MKDHKNGDIPCEPPQKCQKQSGYQSKLNLYNTEVGIKLIKDNFERKLAEALNLTRVSAPLFVLESSGLNDDLSGVEKAVRFEAKTKETCVIVHSLAKWKRQALSKYGFHENTGLYTDMNAIRRDDDISPLHSYYVDQWDWELIIGENDRTLETLKTIVRKIFKAIGETEDLVNAEYGFSKKLPKDIYFVTSQELEDTHPTLTPRERENVIAKEHGAVFLIGIGEDLKSGKPHDLRAPDYDDWSLNGDIIVYSDMLGCSVELSSMGIRVTKESMLYQLKKVDRMDMLERDFHKNLIDGKLPLCVGGGIGQSRLCLFLLEKMHIGEVQVSVWPKDHKEQMEEKNIFLL